MAKSPPGYLLPEGECYTDELACTLVFYPDKPEYRRALLGSITYLSTWLAWERDADKRGQDAARAWKNAVDETLGCWTMACFEELIADVEAIRILMENKKDCCDDNLTYYPDPPPTSDIEPFIGDPPEFYGETAVTDWDDWAEHVCYNANKYVDYLKGTADELERTVLLSTIYVGIIAAALALLAFSGIGLAISYGLAATIVGGLVLSATISTFEDTAANIEANRDDIVCTIMNGGSLADAIESALSSGTDWDLFYQFVDYASAVAIIHEGGFESEYLPSELDASCDCAFEPDLDGWELWGTKAVVSQVSSSTPPACDWDIDADDEMYITLDNCAVPYDGKLRIAGFIDVVGTMTENANCTDWLWLKVQLWTSFSMVCKELKTNGPKYTLYETEDEPAGAISHRLPFDIETAVGADLATVSLRLWVSTFAGAVDLESSLHVLLIEPVP